MSDRRVLGLLCILFSQVLLISSFHHFNTFIRTEADDHTTRTVTDHGDYVTMDWEPSCAQITKWKDYKYLPSEPRGYVVHIWGRFEPDNAHVFGTLKDAQQYVEMNWCRP